MMCDRFAQVGRLSLETRRVLSFRRVTEELMGSDADNVVLTDAAAVKTWVRGCWEDALLFDDFGDDDGFFDIGGHSLLIADIMAGLGTRLGRRIPLMVFFEHPTVNELSSHLHALVSAERRDD
jgi:acyl carrier protein